MATILELMPYLEQGYIAHDEIRRAYLEPKKRDGVLMFEWKAYEMEGEWSGPDIHTAEHVRTWKSSHWEILCSQRGSEYGVETSEGIEHAIKSGFAYKSQDFDNP